jgi:hypothetical protein
MNTIQKRICENGDNIFGASQGKLICKLCRCQVSPSSNSVKQHLITNKHKYNITHAENSRKLSNMDNARETFVKELVSAFTSADIPLQILEVPSFKNFCNKYLQTGFRLPLTEMEYKSIN